MNFLNACNVFSLFFSLISFSIVPAASSLALSNPIVLAVDPPIDGQSHLFVDLESRLKLEGNSFETTFFSGAFRGTTWFGGTYDLNRTSISGGPSLPDFTICKLEFEDAEDDEYDHASLRNGRPRGFLEKGREISAEGAIGVRCAVWIAKSR